jgi:hypothetical protein
MQKIQFIETLPENEEIVHIDTRSREQSSNYPMSKKAIVISQDNANFIGMIGAIVKPSEHFILIIEKKADAQKIMHSIMSI